MLRCLSTVVLDYWKQEMAVTGDETESGTVALIHVFVCHVQRSADFLEIFMHVLLMSSAVF